MGDRIESLPVDELPPSNEEKDMIQWMYHQDSKVKTNESSSSSSKPTTTIRFEIQSMFILFLCCLLFTSQWTWMDKSFPVFQTNPLFGWIFKSFLFTVFLIFFFNFFYLKPRVV